VVTAEDVGQQGGNGKIRLDEAIVTLKSLQVPLYFIGGKTVMPFGVFEDHLIEGTLAEDAAKLLSKDAGSVTVTAVTYTDVVQTLDFTPIEPDATEYKYYARGVGVIKEEALADGVLTEEFVELVSKNF
jgi:hypothetical protein